MESVFTEQNFPSISSTISSCLEARYTYCACLGAKEYHIESFRLKYHQVTTDYTAFDPAPGPRLTTGPNPAPAD